MTKLTPRQENLLATMASMVAAAAQPSPRLPRERQYVFDQGVYDWFNRVLTGTRTPEPATHEELVELHRLLNHSQSVEVA